MTTAIATINKEGSVIASLDIPSIQAIAWQIIYALGNSNLSSNDLERIITMDQGVTARLLKVANSASFSRGCEISEVDDAIMRVGFETVRSSVIMASFQSLRFPKCQIDALLWEHSLSVGVAAPIIKRNLDMPNPSDILIPALLHDIGKSILNRNAQEEYKQVVEQVNQGEDFVSAELKFFSVSHIEVGVHAVKQWRLPENIATLIALHHCENVMEHRDADTRKNLLVLRLANSICSRLGLGLGYPASERETEFLTLLGVKDTTEWINDTEEDIKKAFSQYSEFANAN